MTQRTLSPRALKSLTAENTQEVWLVALTIRHPSLEAPIRVVNNNEDIQSRVGGSPAPQTFIGLPFEIELPGEDSEEPGSAMIAIPNVDRAITQAAREITGPAAVDIHVVLASQPDVVEVEFFGMELRDVRWDANRISGRLHFETIVTEPCCETITPARFPGLF